MSNELTIKTTSEVSAMNFKNDSLRAYSIRISELADSNRANSIEVARILGKVKSEKCYEDDGFKSVADYAEVVFGIKRSMAYQMAKVGEEFYNSEDVNRLRLTEMPMTVLAEMTGLSEEEFNTVTSTINTTDSQKAVRDKVKAVKANSGKGTVTVEKKYKYTIQYDDPMRQYMETSEIITYPGAIDDTIATMYGGEYSVTKASKGTVDGHQTSFLNWENGAFARLLKPITSYEEPKAKEPNVDTVTAERMARYEAAMAKLKAQGIDVDAILDADETQG